jgi:GTPase SAR1 family protein
MSAQSAGARAPLAFDESLYELKAWREATVEGLAMFRRWAIVARLIDEHAAARLAHLERRVLAERLTIAFIGEPVRGKSELVNALFFADLSGGQDPPGALRTTLCPTEILHDPMRPAGIRLLPIETRAEDRPLRELRETPEAWTEVELDPAKPEALGPALQMLAETVEVSAAVAATFGYSLEGVEAEALVDVPRWRHAVVNFPHALLKAGGLVILVAPGRRALEAEPELTLNRISEADAVIFTVSVDSVADAADRELWANHLAPAGSDPHTRFIVLNKIDQLRDGVRDDLEVLAEIDRHVKATAETLGVDPTRVFALSARQGLEARLAGDRDALIRSRVYRLEQALVLGLLHRRHLEHATSVRAEFRPLLAESRALLEGRHSFISDQLQELEALKGKNQKMLDLLGKKAVDERARLESARQAIVGLRGVHNRLAEELARLLEPGIARDQGVRARQALLDTPFSSGIGEALDGYFARTRDRLEKAIEKIAEVQGLINTFGRKFESEYGIGTADAPEFSTERFIVELDRLEEHCMRDFRSATSLLIRGRKALGASFFDTIALKVVLIFEIADREVRAWMASFIRPLETQVTALQDQANGRVEGMGRMQTAGADLTVRVEELSKLLAEVDGQRAEWEAHQERLLGLVRVEKRR